MTQVNVLNWLPIKIDDSLGIDWQLRQVRFPRSKKRRIRKKWAKQRRNFKGEKVQLPVAYLINNQVLVMNSAAFLDFKKRSELEPLKRAVDFPTASSMMLATIGQNLGLPVTSHLEDAMNYATASAEYATKALEMRVRHYVGPRFR